MLLRVLRLKAGVDQGLLADKLGVSQPTISRYEKGSSAISLEHARAWAALCIEVLPEGEHILGQQALAALEALLEADGDAARQTAAAAQARTAERALVLEVSPALAAIPCYADVAAGIGEAQEPRSRPRARLEVPARLLERDGGCYALRVSGQSMEPLLYDGDIVVVSPAAPLADGCIVAAWVEPDGDVVKLYHPLPGGGAILQPANPAFAPVVLERDGGRGARVWGRIVFQQREL